MNRILVALDASERAEAVLRYAAELAGRTGAKLVLFRAVAMPIDLPAQVFSVAPSELAPVLIEQASAALHGMSARLPAGLVERVEVEMGSAWQTVCDAAKRLDADLVVVGSHGYGALDRLLGTTAARIVNHASCPVLVVRHPEAHPV